MRALLLAALPAFPAASRPNDVSDVSANSFAPDDVCDVSPNSIAPNDVSDVSTNSLAPDDVSDGFTPPQPRPYRSARPPAAQFVPIRVNSWQKLFRLLTSNLYLSSSPSYILSAASSAPRATRTASPRPLGRAGRQPLGQRPSLPAPAAVAAPGRRPCPAHTAARQRPPRGPTRAPLAGWPPPTGARRPCPPAPLIGQQPCVTFRSFSASGATHTSASASSPGTAWCGTAASTLAAALQPQLADALDQRLALPAAPAPHNPQVGGALGQHARHGLHQQLQALPIGQRANVQNHRHTARRGQGRRRKVALAHAIGNHRYQPARHAPAAQVRPRHRAGANQHIALGQYGLFLGADFIEQGGGAGGLARKAG